MNSFILFWKSAAERLKAPVYTAFVLILAARVFAIFLNVPKNLGELVRPDLSFPEFGIWLYIAVYVVLFIAYFRSIKRFPKDFQFKSALVYPAAFIIFALTNLKLGGSKPALFRIFEAQATYEDLSAVLIMDMFFQSPFIVWSLLFYGLVFYITRKAGYERIIDLLCILPFFQFTYYLSNYQLIFAFAVLFTTLISTNCAKGRSPRYLHYFFGLTFVSSVAYLLNFAIIYSSSLISVLVLFFLCWLLGFRMIKFAESHHESGSPNHSWFFLLFFSIVFSFSVNRIPMGICVFNFWLLLFSFGYAFMAISHLTIISIIAVFFGLFSKKAEKAIFYSLAFLLFIFYVVDGFVFFNMGQSVDFHAIDWVLSLSTLSMFLNTAVKVVSIGTLVGLIIVPTVLWLSASFVSGRIIAKSTSRTKLFLIIILGFSAISNIGSRMLNSPVAGMSDPVNNLIGSVPYFKNYFSKRPTPEALKKRLDQAGFNIEETTKKFVESQRQQNVQKPANLILITLESTGTRYLQLFGNEDATTPKLESLKDRIEIFPFYFSSFAESSNAEFSIFSGIIPSTFHIFRSKPVFICNTLIEVLKASGFDCSLFFSIYTGNTGIANFYRPRGADRMYDATTMPGMTKDDGWIWGVKEHFVVDRISDFLKEKSSSDQPFFIYYRAAFPHAPFNQISDHPTVFGKSPNDAVGRFKDCISYLDSQIFRIVEALDANRLSENTYIMITSDHVTSLGENGQFGHGWNCDPHLTNVPLIIIRPNSTGLKINPTPGSHIDILPTALNLCGVKSKVPVVIQGMDLLTANPAPRKIFLASFNHLALQENDNYYWYYKDLNSMKVMSMKLDGRKPIFEPLKNYDIDRVNKNASIMLTMEYLQRFLIMDFEYYTKYLQATP